MRLLSDEELAGLAPAEFEAFPGPIPTQIVASEEFLPVPQTVAQQPAPWKCEQGGYVIKAREA